MSERRLPPGVRRVFRFPCRSATRVLADVDDEVRLHIEMRVAELANTGLSQDEAFAQAMREFGSVDELRRHALSVSIAARRRERSRNIGAGVAQDVRFALRQIRRAKLFAAVAVVTLGLGIGANSAIFSVVHHLVLAPLPYPDADRIVELMQSAGGGHILFAATQAELEAWRARARSLEEITTADPRQFVIGVATARERITGAAMEPNLLNFVGTHAIRGRAFTSADARSAAAPVAMLGYGLWQRSYGGRDDVLGRTIVVDDTTRAIIGVAPPGLSVPMDETRPAELWIPLAADNTALNAEAFAKLRSGITPAQASRELTAIARQLSTRPGEPGMQDSIAAMRPQDFLGASYQRALVLLFAAVAVVLLIACANVANLLLVRAWGRQREFAIRAALGAGRLRLARQLVTESLMLACVGGLFGLGLAWAGLHVFRAIRPTGLESLDGVGIESAVLLWTAAIAIGTGLLFGIGPMWFATARTGGDSLKTGTRSADASLGARRVRGALIVLEVALSVVLLVGAGLLVRSFRAMEHIELGFDPSGLASFSAELPRGTPSAQWSGIFADVLAQVRALPGVEGAELATGVPPDMGVAAGELEIDGTPASPPIKATGYTAALPGFFHLARIRLRGHTFDGDTTGRVGGPNEVIINEALARRLMPRGDPIGHQLRSGPDGPSVTIVGVADNVFAPGRRGDVYQLQRYYPAATMGFPSATIVLRSNTPIDALVPTLRRVVAQVDPRLELWHTRSSATEIASLLAAPRFAMALVSAFAMAALILSAVGLYGVISYAVSQRTREIGVRVALGAEPRDIARLVMRSGAALALGGLALGLGGAIAAGRVIQSYLYGVTSTDPVTYAGITLLLGAVGLAALYVPARRAMRVDPVVALNVE